MKIRSISRVLLAATPMVVGGILASGSSALAQSNNGPCSNATLSGDYAGRFAGTILATASDPETQVTGVTLTHYEGNGSFTSVEHVVFSGFPPPPGGEWTPASGTYTVNEDCTGSSVTHSANTSCRGSLSTSWLSTTATKSRAWSTLEHSLPSPPRYPARPIQATNPARTERSLAITDSPS